MKEQKQNVWLIRLIAAALFLIPWALYLKTSVMVVYTADNGELVSTAFNLGAPHPTGYTAYNILGRLFFFLPFAAIPSRLAIMSAFFASMSVLLMFKLMRDFFGSTAAAAAGAFMAALAQIYWDQATVGEVYSLHIFLMLLVIDRFEYALKTKDRRHWYFLAFLLSLAVGHHMLTLLIGPALLFRFIQKKGYRLLKTINPLLLIFFFILGYSMVIYIAMRYDKTKMVQWGDLSRYPMFIRHILGRRFHHLASSVNQDFLLGRISMYIQNFFSQFSAVLVIPVIIGVYRLIRKNLMLFIYLFLIYVTDLIFALNYQVKDIEVFFLQGFVMLAFFSVPGWKKIFQPLMTSRVSPGEAKSPEVKNRFRKALIPIAGLILLVVPLTKNYYQNNKEDNFIIHDYSVNILNSLPTKALLLTQGWSFPFVFFYNQEVLDYRPDLDILIDNHGNYLEKLLRVPVLPPIYTDIPLPIQALKEPQKPFGFVYHVGTHYPFNKEEAIGLWRHFRIRGLYSDAVYKDFHNRALTAMHYIMWGERLLLEDRREEARVAFREAERLSLGNQYLWNFLACLYLREKEYQKAELMCRQALKNNPDFITAKFNLASILQKSGRELEALRLWKELESTGYKRLSYQTIGEIFLKNGEYDKAVDLLEKANLAHPNTLEIMNNLGLAYSYSRQFDRAEVIFKRALRINFNDPKIYNNLGSVYMAQEQHDIAIKTFRQALRIEPGFREPQLNLGIIAARIGDYKKAEEIFNSLLSENMRDYEALNNLALLKMNTGDARTAEKLWTESLKINPRQPHIASNLDAIEGDKGHILESYSPPERVMIDTLRTFSP